MPMYEYRCAACDQVFEKLQKFSDEPLKVHEGCGGAVVRLISPPAFQFKGSGWYITDYAKKNGSSKDSSASSSSTSDSSKSAKTESKTESKPAESKPAAPAAKP